MGLMEMRRVQALGMGIGPGFGVEGERAQIVGGRGGKENDEGRGYRVLLPRLISIDEKDGREVERKGGRGRT